MICIFFSSVWYEKSKQPPLNNTEDGDNCKARVLFSKKKTFLSLDMLVILLVAKPLTSVFGSFNQKNKITKLKSIGLDIDMILIITILYLMYPFLAQLSTTC